jgi:hypothetical protein
MEGMQECSLSIRSISEEGTHQHLDDLKIDNKIAVGVLLKDIMNDYSTQCIEEIVHRSRKFLKDAKTDVTPPRSSLEEA